MSNDELATEGLEVEEPDCEQAVEQAEEAVEALEEAHELEPSDVDAVARVLKGEQPGPEVFLEGCLGPRGGAWGGASAPVDRAQAIGIRNGLRVMSRKRSSGSSGSDHHTSQKSSDAVDLSNGGRPTPEMDRVAKQIASLLGVPNWNGGVLCRVCSGYRVQLLYKTYVGGNHFNHVHVGVRVGGRC
jgi:hypothetical protein